jgi:hypothetical protein
MFFRKKRNNRNEVKSPGKKRKVFANIALLLSLVFTKPRPIPIGSLNKNYSYQKIYKKDIERREFNLLKENDQQIVLTKAEGSSINPSSFPTSPSISRPSRSLYVLRHRTSPKLVDYGFGAGGGNGGENPEFDNQNSVSKTQQSQESKIFDHDYYSNNSK